MPKCWKVRVAFKIAVNEPVSDDFAVDGARHAVVQLHIYLGEDVALVYTLVTDISKCCGFHHVPAEGITRLVFFKVNKSDFDLNNNNNFPYCYLNMEWLDGRV